MLGSRGKAYQPADMSITYGCKDLLRSIAGMQPSSSGRFLPPMSSQVDTNCCMGQY